MDTKTMKSYKIKCSNPCLCCKNPPSRSLFKPRLFFDYLPEYPYMLQSWAKTAKDSYRTEASCFNIHSSIFNIISFLGWKIPKVLQILTVNQRASENMVDIWLFASELTSSTDHPRPELRPKATFMSNHFVSNLNHFEKVGLKSFQSSVWGSPPASDSHGL